MGNMRTLFWKVTVLAAVGGVAVAADLSQPANTWIKRSPLPSGPAVPRLGYEGACAWDSSRNLFIRYGGHNQGGGGAQYSEIWTWDPFSGQWTLKEPDISPPGVCCAQQNLFDPLSRRYVRFPAFSGSHGWQWFREIYLNDSTIWMYDLVANRWKDLRPVPAPHVSPLRCASWDSDAQVIVLFGGEGNREGTVVYDPHANTWTRMKPPAEPAFRSAGNMVYDEAHKRHILFGSQFTDDPHTWAYDLRANRWTDMKPPVQPPTKENDAVLAYDRVNAVVVCVVKVTKGQGEGAKHVLQTWTYDTGANCWRRMNPPREPDPTGNRSRVLVYADALGMSVLENRTRSKPGPPEQQMWTYCFRQIEHNARLRPGAPTDLELTTTSTSIRLSWRARNSEGVTGYVVYRGTGAHPWTVEYKPVARLDADETVHEDRDLDRQAVSYYCVSSIGQEDVSPKSMKVRTQPPIVEDIVVSVLSAKEVLIDWAAPQASDIVGYHIERATAEVWTEDQLKRLKSKVAPLMEPSVGAIRTIGQFERITKSPIEGLAYRDRVDLKRPVTAVGEPPYTCRLYEEHLDRAGRSYRYAVYAYRVRAVNALGIESGPSPCILTIPSAPRWVFAQEDSGTCRLKWHSNPEKTIAGYRVYRMDGRWEKDSISRLTAEPVETTRWTDNSAGKPTRRYYIVAVDLLGQEGLPSSPVWYNREWRRFYEPFVGPWHQ
ncbi:MAG: fibronectin type III domain-containing protein [Phycisphaerales bacterium]|nr:MAG: fibronectin type III domain-containing protein [Phycisphaerales bacterium]